MNKRQAQKLLKLADYLEKVVAKHPKGKDGQRKFDMTHWFDKPQDCKATKPGFTEGSCGTSACAFGWAVNVFPRQLKIDYVDDMWEGQKFSVVLRGSDLEGLDAAEDFFGIDFDDSLNLFGDDVQRTPIQEAKVIRNFVKKQQRKGATNEAD